MENAQAELRALRLAIESYERNDEFMKAALIRQLYNELACRFNGLPEGSYWNLS
jgi:hypothetical protein